MDSFYWIGEPQLGLNPERETNGFFFPVGQLEACCQVLAETQDEETITEKLRQEYLAIVMALKTMGIDFRIIFGQGNFADQKLVTVCVEHLGCKLIGSSGILHGSSVAFPRDFATILPGIVLLNDKIISEVRTPVKDGYSLMPSPYGEGGRVLAHDNTLIVCKKLVVEEHSSVEAEVGNLTSRGLRFGFFPSPLNVRFKQQPNRVASYFSNDHIDRVACLIKGKNGELHFVVDPKLETADWSIKMPNCPWSIRPTEETMKYIGREIAPLGVEVCSPKSMSVPYSLNLIQFDDGRILMTGGDEDVRSLMRDLIGQENVFETSVPIKYFPVWRYAGIRCMVSEAPLPIIKKAS